MAAPALVNNCEIFDEKRGNRFNDFSNHFFTSEQKVYVAKLLSEGTVKLEEFLSRHSITSKRTSVHRWVKTYEKGKKIYEFGGRPPSIDNIGKEEIKNFVKNGGNNGNPILKPKFREVKAKVIEQVRETSKRKGVWGKSETPDPKTLKKVLTEVKAIKVKGQQTTNARVNAICDPRNFFTFAIMCAVCCRGLDSKLILNWDATTFGVSKDDGDALVYINDEEFDNSKPVTGLASGDTCLFIKLYHYHNAFGTIAPPVYVIADDTLSESDFEFYEVKSLSRNGCEGNGTGYACFTKTRAGNDQFYKWFNERVIVPFILKTREDNDFTLVR